MKLAVIFNGQGAHYQGMGKDFNQTYNKASEIFEKVESETKYPIRRWIEEDPDRFSETRYAQLAVTAVSLAIYNSIKQKLPVIEMMAGLSLGEYSSLMASGMLSYDQGFQLLKQRGELMSTYCEKLSEETSFKMSAAIKMPLDEVRKFVNEEQRLGNDLYIANINSSQQIVIGGSKEGVKGFNKNAKEFGYKKTIPLKVEGPFHTPLMEDVCEPFSKSLENVVFSESTIPVISNTTVKPHETSTVKETLLRHFVEPVKWKQTIDYFKDEGITHIIQIGPGDTLKNLLKREENVPECLVIDKVDDVENIEPFLYGGE